MSKLETPAEQRPSSADADPYRYGYRDVPVRHLDGSETWERSPLTLEDLLHPQMDDHAVITDVHAKDCRYLTDVIAMRVAPDPQALVLSDTGIFWDDPELKHHAPDVAVIFGVQPRETWPTFHVAREGVRPRWIIEVVSPDYRKNDVETKYRQYHAAGVPYYVLVDRLRTEGPPSVIGYRHTVDGWVEMPLDDRGRLLLDDFGLLLGVEGNRAVLYDAATGQEMGDYTRVCELLEAEALARQAAEELAHKEAQARTAAEADRAAAETARAAAEADRAAAEAARAAAEARVLELEELLRRRNGPSGTGPKA